MDYNELFSTFGYLALDIILDIDISELCEVENRKLVSLVVKAEENSAVREQISEVCNSSQENSKKLKKLLSIADETIVELK